MKTIIFITFLHLIGIAILVFSGVYLNDQISQQTTKYQGVTFVLSVAFGIYSFAVNILYRSNPSVFLFVNSLMLKLRPSHTYWLPAFDLSLADCTLEHRKSLIQGIHTELAAIPHKSIKRKDETPFRATICLDDKIYLILRIDEQHLFVSLDRKILVPSHLYDAYQQKFARIGEILREVAKPESIRLSLTITFEDEVVNPYYGFFVQRVPSHLLSHFEASFKFGNSSSCRIEAGTTSINIEGTSAVDFFAGVSQVLALRASPTVGTTE